MNSWLITLEGTLLLASLVGFVTFIYASVSPKQAVLDSLTAFGLSLLGLWLLIGVWFSIVMIVIGVWNLTT